MNSNAREPREYQNQAVDFGLRHPRFNLHAGMGLGKTYSVLALLHRLQSDEPALALGPLRVARSVWTGECAEWDQLRGFKVIPVVGTVGEREEALRTPAHLHTINYDNVQWLCEKYGDRWPFRTVIADESTRLKGFRLHQGTKRSNALSRIAHTCVKRWANLTGTPAPNGLGDLWGQQWYVDGGAALGRSYSAFQQRWMYTQSHGQHKKWVLFDHAFDQIVAAIRPTTLTIDAKDWFDVDEPIVNPIYVELPDAARKQYRQMEKQFFAEVERGTVTAATAGVKAQKLLQMASGAVYHEDGSWSHVHDAKIPALESVIEEAAGAQVLVVYQFKHELERLQKFFPRIRHIKAADHQFEEDWNKLRVPLACGHPKSFGHGLSLQHGGNTIVYFGQTFDLELHLQVMERIGPIRQAQSGYDRPVYVHHILAKDTMDEDVMWRRNSKANLSDTFQRAMKNRA